ncbi:hypothetical protein [Sanguibacter suaedae]|uniref:DUF3221 domain-containing protein n=1 Tax=Sanguibacter suaedae TaxID=2795737 RepID=A0A934IDV5_9MICO|nr:hypothetical protein [Sanguibacter suaedae]MBI9115134.1 hypothetical protein [Sanguibacter suaedae]
MATVHRVLVLGILVLVSAPLTSCGAVTSLVQSSDDPAASIDSTQSLLGTSGTVSSLVEAADGKKLIVVFRAEESAEEQESGPDEAPVWVHTRSDETEVPESTDVSLVVSSIDAWVASQPDPAEYEVVVLD